MNMSKKVNMITNSDIDKTSEYCRKSLNFDLQEGSEYSYSCLPLTVIDAIFATGVLYKGVQNTVEKVCAKWGIPKCRDDKSRFPQKGEQMSISMFLEKIDSFSNANELADKVYDNRQRTSSTNGMLKAQAVTELLKVLQQNKIEYWQDVEKIKGLPNFETEFKAIKGQSSGVAFKYFLMLTGATYLIKPDRMIVRFLIAATGKRFSHDKCQEILTKVTETLTGDHPKLTAQKLDYVIWVFQREQEKQKQKSVLNG
jgi:hypothetical protein